MPYDYRELRGLRKHPNLTLLQASRAKPVYFSAQDENISFVLIFLRTAAADRTIK